MMRHLSILGAAAVMAACSLGCANVTSSVSGNTVVNGEAWYVKTTSFFGLVFGADIYYCPPPQGEGPATCQEAQMFGDGDPFTAAAKQTVDDASSDDEKEEEDGGGEEEGDDASNEDDG